jgi:2-methylaconitate cis-trans-isomerase PrpF
VVAGPREAHTLSGEKLEAEAADVTIRMISIGQPHRAVPLTGAMCLAVASRLSGSVANGLARRPSSPDDPVRIAQPSGVTIVGAAVRRDGNGWLAEHATVYRTTRRLMDGMVCARVSALSQSGLSR